MIAAALHIYRRQIGVACCAVIPRRWHKHTQPNMPSVTDDVILLGSFTGDAIMPRMIGSMPVTVASTG